MQTTDEQFVVATPELVEFGYEVAGVGSRFIAALVDSALIAVIYLLIQVAGLATSYGGQKRKYDIGPASGPRVHSRSGSPGRGTGWPVPSTMYLR